MRLWERPAICAFAVFCTLIWASPALRQSTIRDATARGQDSSSEEAALAKLRSFASMPMTFEANIGQTDPRVGFVSRGPGYTLYLTPAESVLSLRRPVSPPPGAARPAPVSAKPGKAAMDEAVVRMRLVGSRPGIVARGREALNVRTNYLLGSDPAGWRTNVPTYARVKYENAYPGIDLVFYGNQRQLEYDLIVAPGADPSPILLEFDGARRLELDAEGDLVLHTNSGPLKQRRPFVYQEVAQTRRVIPSGYVLHGQNRVSFQVDSYDSGKPLIIDPVLVYSSFLGGSGAENGRFLAAIAVDSSGDAYVTGSTDSLNFPGVNALQPAASGSSDAYVARIDATGSSLVYCTYLGGSSLDRGMDIAVDQSGNAYLTGRTQSTNFPTVSPLQGAIGGMEDAFMVKLAADGSRLLYSTYLGGSGVDYGMGLAVDLAGSAYVFGSTASSNLPTSNAFQSRPGGAIDAFVAKLSPAGSSLAYLTYLGGSGPEVPGDTGGKIAVDRDGNACVAGITGSRDFPTRDALQPVMAGQADAFVAKLNESGTDLIYSTYLGGSGVDGALGIAVDRDGRVYVSGVTESTDFPLLNPIQSRNGGDLDAFVTKIDTAGSSLVFSSYIGGEAEDIGYDIAVDSSGSAHITGTTTSLDFPVADPLQGELKGNRDAFVVKLTPPGTGYMHASYLGGYEIDYGLSLAVDAGGDVFVAGQTSSTDFPVVNGFQTTLGGGSDAFVVRVRHEPSAGEFLYYLPQVANGSYAGGRFRTTFVIFNPNEAAARASIRLTDDNGGPMAVRVPEFGTGEHFNLVLESGASIVVQTDGSGELRAGAAVVKSDQSLGVSAIFSLYNAAGNLMTETGVGSSKPAQGFKIPVEVSASLNTGVALVNTERVQAAVILTLFDEAGQQAAMLQLSLAPDHHWARFIGEGQLFPTIKDFKGTLAIFGTPAVAALALRQTQAPIGYTSLQPLDQRSRSRVANLAQVANGSFGPCYFRTSFLLFNNWVTPAAAALSLWDSGSGLFLALTDGQSGGRFEVQIPRNGSRFISSDGSGALATGSASIASDVPLGAAAILSVFDTQGRFQTEAGIGNSPLLTAFTLPVEVNGNLDTGVALFNPGSTTASIGVRLLDAGGKVVNTTSLLLAARSHIAPFVTQLFPGTLNLRGTLAVNASAAVAALALRQNANPLFYTTLPVTAGSARGRTP
jgi:Beta-propeller repeat